MTQFQEEINRVVKNALNNGAQEYEIALMLLDLVNDIVSEK